MHMSGLQALSLLPEPLPAGIRLDMDTTAIGGLIRNALLALGSYLSQAV